MTKTFKSLILAGLIAFIQQFTFAQTEPRMIVTLDKPDWVYRLNEPATFGVRVEGLPASDSITITYDIGPEKMASTRNGSMKIAAGGARINGGTLASPGFLRGSFNTKIGSKNVYSLATAAYEPEKLLPTNILPDDFMVFWEKAKESAAKVPMDARMTPWPERSNEKVNVYKVDFQAVRPGSRMYGILSVPNRAGKFPAILHVPGAGVRAYNGDQSLADEGIITLQVGIHGIPVDLPAEVYTSLANGALSNYNSINLDDRDQYYYKRVYLGCLRANDFLVSLAEYDGVNLGVSGGSQGGALSIVIAALDPRVKALRANYPALSDMTGYLHGRAGGWPHLFAGTYNVFNNKPDRIKVTQYYDVANFARFIKVPGFYSWGFNDLTCPPTSMYAAYNVITAPKELLIVKETGHNTIPSQVQAGTKWLISKFNRRLN